MHKGNRSRETEQCDHAVIAGERRGQRGSPESPARRPTRPRGFAASLRRDEGDSAAAGLRRPSVNVGPVPSWKAEPLGCSKSKRERVGSPAGPPVPVTSLRLLVPSLPLKPPPEVPRGSRGSWELTCRRDRTCPSSQVLLSTDWSAQEGSPGEGVAGGGRGGGAQSAGLCGGDRLGTAGTCSPPSPATMLNICH